jgi:hypothetical protein
LKRQIGSAETRLKPVLINAAGGVEVGLSGSATRRMVAQ